MEFSCAAGKDAQSFLTSDKDIVSAVIYDIYDIVKQGVSMERNCMEGFICRCRHEVLIKSEQSLSPGSYPYDSLGIPMENIGISKFTVSEYGSTPVCRIVQIQSLVPCSHQYASVFALDQIDQADYRLVTDSESYLGESFFSGTSAKKPVTATCPYIAMTVSDDCTHREVIDQDRHLHGHLVQTHQTLVSGKKQCSRDVFDDLINERIALKTAAVRDRVTAVITRKPVVGGYPYKAFAVLVKIFDEIRRQSPAAERLKTDVSAIGMSRPHVKCEHRTHQI